MELKLTLLNGDRIAEVFKLAPSIAFKEYRIALEKIAAKAVSEAKRNAPVNKGQGGGKKGYGGNLRQSISYSPTATGGFIVNVNANYAAYVDQGTRPHLILPRFKSVLAFQINGKWVRTKMVRHPGTKATHFFTNAIKTAETYGNQQMSNAMTNVLNKIAIG